jgi:CBS domain-containing protein
MAATVADIMDRDAPFVTLEAGVEEVVELFKEQDVPALPVVNASGRCVGIVTEAAHVIVERGHSRLPVVEHGRYLGLVTRADVLDALQQEG